MNQFFTVYLYDVTSNETIWFSKPDGSFTDIVILDDGWAPNVTKYVRDGEKTWSDVVEELECMTNVATRDEALALLEKLNAVVHRASRDIEEKQDYTLRFTVQAQFSNALQEAFTYIISPPDDGNVITLSTDIQTAPPGQIRFKLRFKRTGAWITSGDITHFGTLTSDFSPPSGFWKLQTTLPTNITIPTPISLAFSFNAGGTNNVNVEKLFLCVNVINVYSVKNFNWNTPFGMGIISYPGWMLAEDNKGYRIQDNTDSYTTDVRPYGFVSLQPGTYAVFVSWLSVQSSVAHRLQVQFDNNAETSNTVLLAKDTSPHYQYLGTVTMTKPANFLYLRTTIGHFTGFEIEKLLLVQLKSTSTIINLSDLVYIKNADLNVENSTVKLFKNTVQTWIFGSYQTQKIVSTHDSVDTVADNQFFTTVVIGNSPNVFSLRTETDYQTVISLPTKITYRSIRTTFH